MPNTKLSKENRNQSNDRLDSGKTVTLKENEEEDRNGDGEERMDYAYSEIDGGVTKDEKVKSKPNSNKVGKENKNNPPENYNRRKASDDNNGATDRSSRSKDKSKNFSTMKSYNGNTAQQNGLTKDSTDDRRNVNTRGSRQYSKTAEQNNKPIKGDKKPSSKQKQTSKSFDTEDDPQLDGYQYDYDTERFDSVAQQDDLTGSEDKTPANEDSEIPVQSDDDDVLQRPRPFTDTADRSKFYYGRYEGDNEKVRFYNRNSKATGSTGALVTIFRNGDKNHNGVVVLINNKNYTTFQKLLEDLEKKMPVPTHNKHYTVIFRWPDGKQIYNLSEFRNRCVYVVSATPTLKRDVYGESREGFWSNKKLSAGRRKNETELYKESLSSKTSPTYNRNSAFVVAIKHNYSPDKVEKIILNPNIQIPFEDWLKDLGHSNMQPVKKLFCEKSPFSEVRSFSQLFQHLKTDNNFIACGDEMRPIRTKEIQKRHAPSSNSSTDSISEGRNRKKKLQKDQEMDQIYENGRPESPSSMAMSRNDMASVYPTGVRGRNRDSRQRYKDTSKDNVVEIEIDGLIKDFYPPTEIDINDDGSRPTQRFKCEWVYGYHGKNAQNLIVLPKTGEVAYYVASIVVLYDKEKDVQRHYIKHNEEITCMALHPGETLIATGQMHGKDAEHASHIRIWHGKTLSTNHVIGLGHFVGGVISIDFSFEDPDRKRTGRMMSVLDGSEKHVLSVWDWQKERLIAKTMTSTDQVHRACFYPGDKSNSILVTYGARHIYFWKIFYDIALKQPAKILRDRNSGSFMDEIPESINCVAFLDSGDIVTGDTGGNLMIWEKDQSDAFIVKQVIPAHDDSVMSLCLMEDGKLLSASGNEIKEWDTSSGDLYFIHSKQTPYEAGIIRTLLSQASESAERKFYIGTASSTILEASFTQDRTKYILEGHSNPIWNVVAIPKQPFFVSAGVDQVVYKWSQGSHKVIWRQQMEAPCTSLAIRICNKHETIAVGTAEGTLCLLNSYNGMFLATVKVVEGPIGCLAFSRDNTYLAMGCSDGSISVLKMPEKPNLQNSPSNITEKPFKGHKSGVCHLDWSKDGRWIRSSSFDNELMYWDFFSRKAEGNHKSMRDVEWLTNTCHMAYGYLGAWSNMEKGEYLRTVNGCHAQDTNLCITGDSTGRVSIYKSPCVKEKAEYRSVRIYSSDVTAVAFTSDDVGVLTCGGSDAALVQWELVDEDYMYT